MFLFNTINSLSKNPFISIFSVFLSYILVYLIIISLIIWIIFYQEQIKKLFSTLLIALSTIVTWLIAEIIKNVSAINRPIIINPIIVEKGFSFPSVHASLTMVIAVVMLCSLNKKIGVWLIFFSVLIGISRVVLGVHYPVDVLAGWILGSIIGFVFIKLFNKL
jgi:undecaprenyl-diphosphatase